MVTTPSKQTASQIIRAQCFGFFKYIIFTIIFFTLFGLWLYPEYELLGLSSVMGMQIFLTLYLLNDLYYVEIGRDRIGATFIVLSLLLSFFAMVVIINGLVNLHINYNINGMPLKVEGTPRSALSMFEVVYIFEYIFVAIITTLYFLTTPFRVPTKENGGGYNFGEGIRIGIKFIFSLASVFGGFLLIYHANHFSQFARGKVIDLSSIPNAGLPTR